MKKTILIAMTIILATVMLAGCSATYNGNSIDQDKTSTSNQTPTKPDKSQEQEAAKAKDGCLDGGLFY